MMNAKKVILFYNPYSGDGMLKHNLDNIIARYQKEGYLIVPIRAADENVIKDYLAALNQESYQDEYRQIIVAGGDGTIHVCVNAMLNHEIDLPLALFPTGTANGFASYFDIPDELNRMIDVALGNHLTVADVGCVNERYFVNMTTIGSIIGVKQTTDPLFKDTFGMFAYYITALLDVRKLKASKVTLRTPHQAFTEDMFFMMVVNGKPGIGRFRKASQEAHDSQIDDGQLDVLLVRKMRWRDIPKAMLQLMKGNYKDSPFFLHFKTDALKVDSDAELPIDIDGEAGEQFPLIFTSVHNQLKIFTLEDEGE
ncbi:MAG: YegS/Rv2252/BmrU family lipid kinase [Firmicutes bacterium]|nr:YegS/Rv2252/BmrU family lipid kinase [Bacillota bacterium]